MGEVVDSAVPEDDASKSVDPVGIGEGSSGLQIGNVSACVVGNAGTFAGPVLIAGSSPTGSGPVGEGGSSTGPGYNEGVSDGTDVDGDVSAGPVDDGGGCSTSN